MICNLGWQKRLFSIEEMQFLEMQELIRRKTLYSTALTEVELPLRQIEADAERIRILHHQHSAVSIHNNSGHRQ